LLTEALLEVAQKGRFGELLLGEPLLVPRVENDVVVAVLVGAVQDVRDKEETVFELLGEDVVDFSIAEVERTKMVGVTKERTRVEEGSGAGVARQTLAALVETGRLAAAILAP
jgi:hypothetical protein